MEKLVVLAKILSDINRVKILALLKRDKNLCVCEICDTLELSQPLVSRHLGQMKKAQLIDVHKEGKWSIYSLVDHSMLEYLLQEIQEDLQKIPPTRQCFSRNKR